jgi:hypothetical protein
MFWQWTEKGEVGANCFFFLTIVNQNLSVAFGQNNNPG